VLDTGVWPESKSFDDTRFGPLAGTWNGECDVGTNFTRSNCDHKLIGARFFTKGYDTTLGPVDESKESRSPRDDDSHDTHNSTATAGSAFDGVNPNSTFNPPEVGSLNGTRGR
ncbi:Subtilisin-like protease SBT1.7, partial [Linum perenne]